MLTKIVLAATATALAVFLMPTKVDAYGAAHVGYTHVGPNGVYHTGETVTSGPGGVHAYGGTTAAGSGGGVYHAGYGGAVGYGGAAAGGYHYTAGYAGGAAVGGASYSYVR
jgi:hypothetical protein